MIQIAPAQDLEAGAPPGRLRDGGSLGDLMLLAYDAAIGSIDWAWLAARLSEMLGSGALDIFVQGQSTEWTEMLGSVGDALADDLELCMKVAREQVCCARRRGSGELAGDSDGAMSKSTFPDLARWHASVPGKLSYVVGERLGWSGAEYVCIAFGAIREDDAPPEAMRNKVEAVLPLLARAAQIDRRLRSAVAQPFTNDAILDCVPFGPFQLDRNGCVVSANSQALAIAQLRTGLTERLARIQATAREAEARLQKAIAEVLTAGGSKRLSIKRGMDARPHAVLVSNIAQYCSRLSQRTACVLFVTCPEDQPSPSAKAIAELFGLMPAEAGVVCGLIAGVSLPNMAIRLGISIDPARTLLSRAMARTGTNSQITLSAHGPYGFEPRTARRTTEDRRQIFSQPSVKRRLSFKRMTARNGCSP